jgi:glycosyltransferase involved in cell wall biosynthesis
MATKDRPEFFRIALDCFLRQTCTRSELIVVDDGNTTVERQCAGIERVRYIRLPEATVLGTKLNVGISAARGRIIQKLDDDDYYQPAFLTTALSHLTGAAPGSIAAWDCFLVLQAGETLLRESGHGWKAGGTLCFPRSLWERQPFRQIPQSVDSFFLRDQGAPVVRVCAPEQYVLVRHGRNTWRQMQGGLDADEFLRTLPVSSRTLSSVVHPAAEEFYGTLAPSK